MWRNTACWHSAAVVRSDTLVRLEFGTKFGSKGLETLEEVVAVLGPPESFEVFNRLHGTWLYIYYPQQGVELWTNYVRAIPDDGVGVLTLDIAPDMFVTEVRFFEPGSLGDILREGHFDFDYSEAAIAERLARQQPWQGFGEVRVTVWDQDP